MRDRIKCRNSVDMICFLKVIAFLCVFLLHSKFFMPIAWNSGVRYPWMIFTPAWAGVWIFFVLSGYGIGRGFRTGRFSLSINGIWSYCIGRLIKIVPLYWFYLLVVAVFITPQILQPSITNLKQLLSLFFLNYQEEFLSREFGLAWYLTTLVRLYWVAPFIYLFLEKVIPKRINKPVLIPLVIVAGMLMRWAMGYHIFLTGELWEVKIYKPFYFNLDFFVSGMLMAYLDVSPKRIKLGPLFKTICLVALFLLIEYNAYIYYGGVFFQNKQYMKIYYYILPTAYLIMCCWYIYLFDIQKGYERIKLSKLTLIKNPLRIIEYFPKILFPMYLFHASVLLCLQISYSHERYLAYVNLLKIPETLQPFVIGQLMTLLALAIAIIWSCVISRLFASKRENFLTKIQKLDIKNALKSGLSKSLLVLRIFFGTQIKRKEVKDK